ncbi:MAG: NAD-dependent epimerase/dehydratase family protein [Corynebacteriales bacterium]|nr:NAD-dependent epimerase/dehydratase family protein [Mycobacteriales bacterium]
MSFEEHHVVTGATGFVGGAIVLELLANTDARITCLVRPLAGASPAERLHRALRHAARGYGQHELAEAIATRVRAVPGNVLTPHCADENEIGPADQLWHSAASLSFEDEFKDSILAHNVEGTRAVLGLAERLGVTGFNQISTAYVSGRREGHIAAEPIPSDGPDIWNNWYERSKVRAEELVLASTFQKVRVFRPSVVVGHSRTYFATNFSGFYAFMKGLYDLRKEVRERAGDLLVFRPLRLRVRAEALGNLIPVDRVAQGAVGVVVAGGDSGIYHLANAQQPQVGDFLRLLAQRLDMKPPICVNDPDEFTSIDEAVDDELRFNVSYMRETRFFDLSSTEKLIGTSVLDVPLPDEQVARYIDWYVRYLSKQEDAT